MKSIQEYITNETIDETIKNTEENQETLDETLNESLSDVLRIGAEVALLSGVIVLFVKSFKEVAKGENGIIDIVKQLREDAKIARISKKLAKNSEAIKILSANAKDFDKQKFQEVLGQTLNEKEIEYLRSSVESLVSGQK